MSEVKYEIEVRTGDFQFSGSNSTVHLILHGSKRNSNPIVINSGLKGNLEKGKSHHVKVKEQDLGDLWQAEIQKVDKLISPNWLLDHIVVKGGGKEWNFPNFKWLLHGTFFIREGRASLEKDDNHKETRKKEIEEARAAYKWGPAYKGLLCNNAFGKPKQLPINEQWNDNRRHDLYADAIDAILSAGWGLLKNLTDKWDHFDDFEKIFQLHMKTPKLVSSWKSDETFGNERLHGATVTQFERIDEIPKKFGVTDEHVKGLLRSGETLASEAKNQRLYMVDYADFDNIPNFLPGRYLCAPIALFYYNKKKKFVPIAIQLYQEPNAEWNPVYTPNDPPNDWLMAKFILGNADFGYFQAITHYVRAHLVCEPVVIATNRTLPSNHPVYKILKPHTKYHIGVNVIGRTNLFNPKGMVIKIGPVDYDTSIELMARFYKKFKYEDLDVRAWLKQRKIPGADVLPEYYYRDDSLALWDAIETFVGEVLKHYYKTDADVASDEELQRWAKEIDNEGYSNMNKFPTKIDSIEQIVRLVTIFIANGVLHHTVVNFAQYESFAFVPMAPACILKTPPGWDKKPVEKGKLTDKDLMEMLPTRGITVKQIAQMYILSQFTPSVEVLGDYYEFYFVEKSILEAKAKFQKRLKEIGVKIEKRGWDHLHPRKCPQSVAN